MEATVFKKEELDSFTGTEKYYKHWLGFNYTDGVQYLAEHAKCYWLLDAIGSYQREAKVKGEGFQVWTLEVSNKKGTLTMRADSGLPVIVSQEMDYTDFPFDSIELWLIGGVLILPSEY